MPKLTRIYTRTGDAGTTGLVGGPRVPKDSLRIECYGTLDECSSAVGLARRALAEHRDDRRARTLDSWLAWAQDAIFNLGSQLATLEKDRSPGMPLVEQRDVDFLEHAIDRAQRDLQPLANFIHPGGSYAGGFLHLARTICRRAERALTRLAREERIDAVALRFVNRLSDAFFVWARWINDALAEPEHLWNARTGPPEIPS